MRKVYSIPASDIAGVCGLHCYQEDDEVLIKFIKSNCKDLFTHLRCVDPDNCKTWNERGQMAAKKCSVPVRDAIDNQEAFDTMKQEATSLNLSERDKRALSSVVHTSRGVRDESSSLDLYENVSQKKVTERNSKMYTHVFHEDDEYKIVCRGRVDGIEEADNGQKSVVEHKRRQNHLFGTVPVYEKVQCHVYMVMTGSKDANLVETYNEDVMAHNLVLEDDFWNKIQENVCKYVQQIRKLEVRGFPSSVEEAVEFVNSA
jgi:hypothetical protein